MRADAENLTCVNLGEAIDGCVLTERADDDRHRCAEISAITRN
jgi:hypothetical protein